MVVNVSLRYMSHPCIVLYVWKVRTFKTADCNKDCDVCLYACLSLCLFVCLCVCLPVCLFVFLSYGVSDCMWHVALNGLLTLFAVRMKIENHDSGFGQLTSNLYHMLLLGNIIFFFQTNPINRIHRYKKWEVNKITYSSVFILWLCVNFCHRHSRHRHLFHSIWHNILQNNYPSFIRQITHTLLVTCI